MENPDNLKGVAHTPPHSIEAEQAVLGAIISSNEKIEEAIESIKIEDFYLYKHQQIYQACLELFEKNDPIDLITLSNILDAKGLLQQIGDSIYLAHLMEFTPIASNISSYLEIVKEKSIRRKLLKATDNIVRLAIDETQQTDQLIDNAENALFSITDQYLASDYTSIHDILLSSFERLDNLHHSKPNAKGLKTGFYDFDNLTAGLHNSDLIIIAARPGMGKSSLAMNIARGVLNFSKKPICYFSLEMSKEQLVDRLLSSEAKVDSWKIRTQNLNDQDFDQLSLAMGNLAELPIFIDDSANLTITEIRTKARRLQMQHGLGLIIIDYLQLMSGRNSRQDHNRVQEISEISRGLKSLARELNIPVIALSQLSRSVESRSPQIPQLADLRESGSIEQDADIVIFIYRRGHYEPESDNPNITSVYIKKHRNGPTGEIKLYWNDKFTQFTSLAKNK